MSRIRKLFLIASLCGLPLAVAALIWFDSHLIIPDCELKVLERWRGGEAKTYACDWQEGNSFFNHYCAHDLGGERIGCWIEKNGRPYSGHLVEWYWYGAEPDPEEAYGIPRLIKSYEDGEPHGTWRIFYMTGSVMNEIEYENGTQVSMKMFSPTGIRLDRSK